ncbi:MAG: hypothetical protein ABJL55_00445 [Roseibium sp.]
MIFRYFQKIRVQKIVQADQYAAEFARIFLEECAAAGQDPLGLIKGDEVQKFERDFWESLDGPQRIEAIKVSIRFDGRFGFNKLRI